MNSLVSRSILKAVHGIADECLRARICQLPYTFLIFLNSRKLMSYEEEKLKENGHRSVVSGFRNENLLLRDAITPSHYFLYSAFFLMTNSICTLRTTRVSLTDIYSSVLLLCSNKYSGCLNINSATVCGC